MLQMSVIDQDLHNCKQLKKIGKKKEIAKTREDGENKTTEKVKQKNR